MVVIAYLSLGICFLCACRIAAAVWRFPQAMKIMNIVWPVTALYGGPLAVWAYDAFGRKQHKPAPLWQSVLKGTLHCGSGCTLGDLLSATLLLYVPLGLMGDWLVEYIAAFLLGILFQYYAIKTMNPQLSVKQALVKALQAAALSLTCWQVGMYGWMAISSFLIFHHRLTADEPLFWLMMQVGMLSGLVTAFPINWWLIKTGIKEAM